MDEAKISDFYDPMELSNGMVQVRSQIQDDEDLAYMHENSVALAEDIMNYVGSNAQANRGVAILAASLMTLIGDSTNIFGDNPEEFYEFCYRFVSLGLPALLMSILTSESIISAKNELEGVPDYGI